MKEWFNTTLFLGDIQFPFTPWDLIFQFFLPLLLFALGGKLISLLIRIFTMKFIEENRNKAIRIARRISFAFFIIGIVVATISLLGGEVYAILMKFFRILNTPFYSSGNMTISIVTFLLIVPVGICASWVGRLAKRGLEVGNLQRFGLNVDQAFTISRLLRYAAMGMVFLFGLSIIGIDLSAIGVLFGVLGIGIGFGLQSIIADFFAGISLIGMGILKEGDRIQVEGNNGVIKHIRLINTELTTFENETLIIPNSFLTGRAIHSFTYKDLRVIIVNRVDVSYDADLDIVITVLKSIATRNPWRYANYDIDVRVLSFGDSGITMELRTWINDAQNRADANSWTNIEIWRAFKENRIEIPYPQRVVHNRIESEALPEK